MSARIVIAGTASGAGKTTVAIGLMAALKEKGLIVQGFKCGPDYIDPSYHTAVTNRPSRNLDSWMLERDTLKDVFQRGVNGADIAVIEGVMGLYDGKSPESDVGSTAEISHIVDAPVLLVVNIGAMARSAAAIVKGFQTLSEHVHIGGVIVNQAGSVGHYELCKRAIEKECNVPVVGYVKKGDVPTIPERHLGLLPAIERGELDEFFHQLSRTIASQVDLDQVIDIARRSSPFQGGSTISIPSNKKARIAVAYDAAFHSYYQENFEFLEEAGAELVYFSPLQGETLPEECDALYIGGALPEEYVKTLSEQEHVKQSIRQKVIEEQMPVYAEGGGFFYLLESFKTTAGTSHSMLGIIRGAAEMKEKLVTLGYRELTAREDTMILRAGEKARGHEFRYVTYEMMEENKRAYGVVTRKRSEQVGYSSQHITASSIHVHFGSNKEIAKRFVTVAEKWKKEREGKI